MRKAGVISGNAHIQLMLSLKRSPITTEKKLQVLFEYECASNGAEFQAYNPIVALGTNSTYLHYNENKSDVGSSPGEILLVDAGGEFEGYAADITRSYPVDGVFTKDAKAIYNVVLEAQEAVLAAVKPGVTWKMLQSTATNVMASKLIEVVGSISW